MRLPPLLKTAKSFAAMDFHIIYANRRGIVDRSLKSVKRRNLNVFWLIRQASVEA
jgi:hypothetical protein